MIQSFYNEGKYILKGGKFVGEKFIISYISNLIVRRVCREK